MNTRQVLKNALERGFDQKETFDLLRKNGLQKGEILMLLRRSGVEFGKSNKEKIRKEYLQELSIS